MSKIFWYRNKNTTPKYEPLKWSILPQVAAAPLRRATRRLPRPTRRRLTKIYYTLISNTIPKYKLLKRCILAQVAAATEARDAAAAAADAATAAIEAAQRELAGAEAGDGRDESNRSLQERVADAQTAQVNPFFLPYSFLVSPVRTASYVFAMLSAPSRLLRSNVMP